jgi:2-oxoglutarate/2-oxoacid ferredoxin oxidoreductase subunit alpha
MSATEQSTNGNGLGQVSTISGAVIRIAGNSQDGIQAIGGFLARLAGRSEQEVMTFNTIPSTISGGPSIFQVRISSGEVLSAGDEADVLLAFYQHSYDAHIGALKKGGTVLFDTDNVQPKPELTQNYHHVGVPISSKTVEAIGGAGKDKGKNIFTLGLVAHIFNLNTEKLTQLIQERFGKKDLEVLENALKAFQAGLAYPFPHLKETFRLAESQKRGHQVVMNGNEAIAYGLITAGVRFGASYPITPWTDTMELLRKELPKYGGMLVQCEDEIASVAMALGASYGGRVAVTGTSGPGLSLKTEAIGWGVMAEVPLVVVDVQRGGPSTGLPTLVEQSDVNLAVYGGHGDSPRIVLAPADVEDCFYTAIEAVNLARKYSTPVIILSDQSIGARIEAFPEPDFKKITQDISPDLSTIQEHKPYDLAAPDGLPRHAAPGTRIMSGRYPILTGLEHDEYGHPTNAPKMHAQMTAKRRKKLQALGASLPVPKVYGAPQGKLLLAAWGSSIGPVTEAVNILRAAGESVSALPIKYLFPIAPGIEEIFSKFEQIRVVEMNDEGVYGYGQFAGLLRSRFCNPKIRGINKVEGQTWKVKEIVERAKAALAGIKS